MDKNTYEALKKIVITINNSDSIFEQVNSSYLSRVWNWLKVNAKEYKELSQGSSVISKVKKG